MRSFLIDFASLYPISGSGLASARINGFLAIFFTISGFSTPAFEKPMNASAPAIASSNVLACVLLAKADFSGDRLLLRVFITPLLSHIIIFSLFAPIFRYIFAEAMAAAPAPLMTILMSPMFFPDISMAFISAADEIIAVPCWSSCITGMSNSAFNLRSISKHSGAFMSSRFIPPNVGAIIFTVSMNFSGSSVPISMSNESIPESILNKKLFPSITGFAASAPMFPSPSTAVPFEMTATKFPLPVYSKTSSLFFDISIEGAATPGEYANAKSRWVL